MDPWKDQRGESRGGGGRGKGMTVEWHDCK